MDDVDILSALAEIDAGELLADTTGIVSDCLADMSDVEEVLADRSDIDEVLAD